MPQRHPVPYPGASRPLLFGHRGCSGAAPENTLSAFALLLERAIPGVELDVQVCRSGEAVVFHDFTLDRITGAAGALADSDLADLRRLDAGRWRDEAFTGERIPLLEEVFDLLGDRVYYDIELKLRDARDERLVDEVAGMIRRRRLVDRVMVSSFNPRAVLGFRRRAPEVATAVIYCRDPGLPRPLWRGGGRFIARPSALKPDRRQVSRPMMRWKKGVLGYPIITWTVDGVDEARRVLALGADGVISNRPEELTDLVREYRS